MRADEKISSTAEIHNSYIKLAGNRSKDREEKIKKRARWRRHQILHEQKM